MSPEHPRKESHLPPRVRTARCVCYTTRADECGWEDVPFDSAQLRRARSGQARGWNAAERTCTSTALAAARLSTWCVS